MTITLSALQKQRRDTAANWTAENPTLLAGELGLESDTGYWKVGDGSTAWTSLAYVSGLGGEIPVSRLADGAAGQIIQTDAAGTDVEWSSTTNLPLGTAAAPAYRFQGDPDSGLFSPGANQVAVATNGTGRLFVDASGRVGIGTTAVDAPLHVVAANGAPLIKGTASTGTNGCYMQLENTAGGFIVGRDNSSGGILGGGAYASHLYSQGAYPLVFSTNSTQRAQIDSSGRLLVGTSTTSKDFSAVFQGNSADATGGANLLLARGTSSPADGSAIGYLSFTDSNHNTTAQIQAQRDGGTWTSGTSQPGRLVFSTTADGASSPTERMSISSTGTHQVYGLNDTLISQTNRGAGTSYITFGGYHSSTGFGTGTASCYIYSNGNVVNTNNSYGALSDLKLKENIVDSSSQWRDIKALQVRNYNFKKETNQPTHTQIGLVAQEAEVVSPGLVYESPDRDEDGNDLGTVTKSVNYSVLYMKAVKALQEAMERIETLEAKVAALETK
jgi:hypothetical protein